MCVCAFFTLTDRGCQSGVIVQYSMWSAGQENIRGTCTKLQRESVQTRKKRRKKDRAPHHFSEHHSLVQSRTLHTINIRDTCTSVCVVFYSHSFWTSSSLDVPAGVTQEEGHTGFLIHLLSAVRALIFLARRIQPFLSLVDLEVEFW